MAAPMTAGRADENPSSEAHPPKNPLQLSTANGYLLTLDDDELVIAPEDPSEDVKSWWDLCSCLPIKRTPTQTTLSYYSILWAEATASTLTISHAVSAAKATVPTTATYPLPPSSPRASEWTAALLARAYADAQPRKRILALVNPFGGRGRAEHIYAASIAPMLAAARCAVTKRSTTHRGHAEEIAAELDVGAYDVVVCCSGDGLPHEVFNGLAKQARPRDALAKVAVANLPCGSGNAMAWNLCGTDVPGAAALAVIKGRRAKLDLVSVTRQGGERRLSFMTQSVGIIAECDLATEGLRWMGDTRFVLGYLTRAVRKKVWPCDVAVGVQLEEKDDVVNAYYARLEGTADGKAKDAAVDEMDDQLPALRFGTVDDDLPAGWAMTPYPNLGNFFAGNMAYVSKDSNFFPAALPNDGAMDLITVDGDISRLRAVALTETVADGSVIDQREVRYRKVLGYRIVPRQKDGYISIDGERMPFGAFQAEVHEGLGCVLSKAVDRYQAKGPKKRGI